MSGRALILLVSISVLNIDALRVYNTIVGTHARENGSKTLYYMDKLLQKGPSHKWQEKNNNVSEKPAYNAGTTVSCCDSIL
ncbi:unnamed protein product, partial [Brenthis ino]